MTSLIVKKCKICGNDVKVKLYNTCPICDVCKLEGNKTNKTKVAKCKVCGCDTTVNVYNTNPKCGNPEFIKKRGYITDRQKNRQRNDKAKRTYLANRNYKLIEIWESEFRKDPIQQFNRVNEELEKLKC